MYTVLHSFFFWARDQHIFYEDASICLRTHRLRTFKLSTFISFSHVSLFPPVSGNYIKLRLALPIRAACLTFGGIDKRIFSKVATPTSTPASSV